MVESTGHISFFVDTQRLTAALRMVLTLARIPEGKYLNFVRKLY